MGISVSAATAIIVAGMFVAFGALYPVAANGFDRVSDASKDVDERALDRQNTDVSLLNATAENGTLTVDLDNVGATGLAVDRTSIVVDNRYVSLAPTDTSVDGDVETNLWLPGERLTVTVEVDAPERVVVVTEHGLRVGGSVEVTN